jgi:predicted transcriptional regulator
MALLALDERNGGTAVSAFVRLMDINLVDLNVVLAMNDFPIAMKAREFCNRLKCEVQSGEDLLERNLYGYTLIDVERAIRELSSTIELSEQMRIPLAVSKSTSVDALVKELRSITPD